MYKLIIILALLVILFFMIRQSLREYFGRGKAPALPSKDTMVQDPVCKLYIAAESAIVEKMGGQMYYFCSHECAHSFKKHLGDS